MAEPGRQKIEGTGDVGLGTELKSHLSELSFINEWPRGHCSEANSHANLHAVLHAILPPP
jgi:hypothetical protein